MIAAIFISHTINDTAENLTQNLLNYFDFCMPIKVMRCVKYTTALVIKMITIIICCTYCDCMLPVRKKILCFYRSTGVKRLRTTDLNVQATLLVQQQK